MTINQNPASRAARANRGNANDIFPAICPGVSQTVNITATSAQSSAFSEGVSIVRLFATTDCFILFGPSPTATNADMFLPAGFTEYFEVLPTEKLAVIQSSANGILYVTEGAV